VTYLVKDDRALHIILQTSLLKAPTTASELPSKDKGLVLAKAFLKNTAYDVMKRRKKQPISATL
jgi:hypothetical protein